MTTTTSDGDTLHRIISDLDENFIVEAGAGTGKTYALVSRVVALVKSGARMRNIVAITFTEAAAAELSERIRSRMEQLLDSVHPDNAVDPLAEDLSDEEICRLRRATTELDQAAIQTIHSFAAQLLRERPLDAGLPPGWATLDEVESSQRFNETWDKWLEIALGRDTGTGPELTAALRYLIEAGAGINSWKEIARSFSENAERLDKEDVIPDIDLAILGRQTLRELQELAGECAEPDDKLFGQLAGAIETVQAVQTVADDPYAAVSTLEIGEKVDFSGNVGSQKNWSTELREVRAQFREIGLRFRTAVASGPLPEVLRCLRREFAVNYTLQRKADGVATFEDLLAWARDLLLNDEARLYFQGRYLHILIDEFQDTDPLQAEIASYLAADPKANVSQQPWHTLPLAPGKLFVVGDAKQSIFRFRRADIGVTQQLKDGGQLQSLTLAVNRRSQSQVLDWVNEVFAKLMVEEAGVQSKYEPLYPHSAIQQEGLGAVKVFGGPSGLNADDTRRLESGDVANIIVASAGDGAPSQLNVYDKERRVVRPAKLADVCILIRSRTGLGFLTRTLEEAGIPYRLEGGSVLFDTQEVRDMLNCLSAINDPTDDVAIAAALRSPAFACSDIDLLRWREAGGSWNYLSPLLDNVPLSQESQERRRQELVDLGDSFPVRAGLLEIRAYHQLRQELGVSQLIARFSRERRLDELDLVENRPREIWRRRQFLGEQARSLEYDSIADGGAPLTLHRFLQWADLQKEEGARITELAVPETDDDAVRIMTMHAAKGLEFPIVVLLGQAQDSARRYAGPNTAGLFFDKSGDSVQVRLGDLRTPDYSRLEELEKAHASAEPVRLAYVAATRARDHLLVSMYQSKSQNRENADSITASIANLSAGETPPHSELSVTTGAGIYLNPNPAVGNALGEYDPDGWQEARSKAFYGRSLPQAITATRLARAGAPAEADIEDKDTEVDSNQPWRTGRGGTAFGSALHAVLQEVLGRMAGQLPLTTDGPAEEFLESWDEAIEQLSQFHADAEGVSSQNAEIVLLARRTLRNPAVVAALRSPRLWSEIPVAAQVETPAGAVVIEGIIDLLYQDTDGRLVILDYKSDQVHNDADVAERLSHYRMQGAVYAAAVEKATGISVKAMQFLFVRLEDGLREVENLQDLMEGIPELIANTGSQMHQVN
ncbi:MAG: UvrD-helicase domain-containing protein [Chloroflexota bacterium]|nr:UvrD-helicase domain-containing protein [Chloroflexota bacterium]